MTTLFNFFLSSPLLFGMLLVLIMLIVKHTPWNLFALGIMWTLIVIVMFCWFWSSELLKRFADWMRKPATWEEDLPDLFI